MAELHALSRVTAHISLFTLILLQAKPGFRAMPVGRAASQYWFT